MNTVIICWYNPTILGLLTVWSLCDVWHVAITLNGDSEMKRTANTTSTCNDWLNIGVLVEGKFYQLAGMALTGDLPLSYPKQVKQALLEMREDLLEQLNEQFERTGEPVMIDMGIFAGQYRKAQENAESIAVPSIKLKFM